MAVDDDGCFTTKISEFSGQYAKPLCMNSEVVKIALQQFM